MFKFNPFTHNFDLDQMPSNITRYRASTTISALKAVTAINANEIKYATKIGSVEDATVLGITLTGGGSTDPIFIQTDSELRDDFFNFPLGTMLFLGLNGEITADVPVPNEYRVKIGHSLGPGAIFISIEEPIFRV
jgi:hypothetical protein